MLTFRNCIAIPPLTLFGRSLLLVVGELSANAVCWIIAGILFGRSDETKSILGLALLAWTLGLRHALDADHISAIDNATRGLIGLGQLPVTCGLYFSLGHSTIVIVVNIAIAISTDIANRLDGIGTVGGIIGAAISGSFLFIIALANTIILIKILRRRKARRLQAENMQDVGVEAPDTPYDPKEDHMIMMRIIGPLITFVNKPWKMYPVGVLFGLGFDTTSSIALLAVSALAKKDSKGNPIPSRDVVILPFLFTAGMTLIDSLDSILMLYSYSGFPEHSLKIFEKRHFENKFPLPRDVSASGSVLNDDATLLQNSGQGAGVMHQGPENPDTPTTEAREMALAKLPLEIEVDREAEEDIARNMRVKRNMMSGLSIILTLMSILAAFSISLITIMSLIGENCTPCQAAANANDGGGLAGRWWRGWAKAADNSGYIGAAIVGSFVLLVAAWYGGRWLIRKIRGQ